MSSILLSIAMLLYFTALIFLILLLFAAIYAILSKTEKTVVEHNDNFIVDRVEVKLQVAEAEKRDLGRGLARISQKIMQTLGISPGDVIEVEGKKITSAIAWPAYKEDQDLDIIRIDEITQKNADVSVNDFVMVRPAKVRRAKYVMLAPVDLKLDVGGDFTNFVKAQLNERTLVEGDITIILMIGQALQFRVVVTDPKGIVKVDSSTELEILEPIENFKQQGTIEQTSYEIKTENKNIVALVTPDLNNIKQNAMQSSEKIKTSNQPLGVLVLPDQTELPITSSLVIGRKDLEKYVPQEKAWWISKQHLTISLEEGVYYVQDIGSTNGTKLNGVEIRNKGKQRLKDGDEILVAETVKLLFKLKNN